MNIGKNINSKRTSRITNEAIADKMWKIVTTDVVFSQRLGMMKPMRDMRDLLGITFNL